MFLKKDLGPTVKYFIIFLVLFLTVPPASVSDAQECQKIYSQANIFEEHHKIQKEKKPDRKRHLILLCTVLNDV